MTAVCAHRRCGREIRQTATGWGHTSPARLFFAHYARPTPGSVPEVSSWTGTPPAGTPPTPSPAPRGVLMGETRAAPGWSESELREAWGK